MEREKKLKRFIEICDAEVFPKNPLKVFITRKRFGERGLASLTLKGHTRYFILESIVTTLFKYSLLLLLYPFVPRFIPRRKWRRDLGYYQYLMVHLLRSMRNMWYLVIPCTHYSKKNDLDLAYIAWHEVRHRVQIENKYTFDTIEKKNDEMLIAAFKNVRPLFEETLLIDTRYEKSEITREIDAEFIAWSMETYAKRELPDINNISEEVFRNFVKDYISLLTWKNSEVEL